MNSDCVSDKACINQKCVNPCPGPCGQKAQCRVFNHNPICSCGSGLIGDPFTRCYPKPGKHIFMAHQKINNNIVSDELLLTYYCISVSQPVQDEFRDPCLPSPCGAFATCRNFRDQASCSCSPGYIGSPPNCRPECITHQDCISSLACINEKCKDPCLGSCGQNALCSVINHVAICSCLEEYKGDPFTACVKQPLQGL